MLRCRDQGVRASAEIEQAYQSALLRARPEDLKAEPIPHVTQILLPLSIASDPERLADPEPDNQYLRQLRLPCSLAPSQFAMPFSTKAILAGVDPIVLDL